MCYWYFDLKGFEYFFHHWCMYCYTQSSIFHPTQIQWDVKLSFYAVSFSLLSIFCVCTYFPGFKPICLLDGEWGAAEAIFMLVYQSSVILVNIFSFRKQN